MVGVMCGDQIVRQLMAKYYPPVNQRIALHTFIHLRQMQLLEIVIITKYASSAIKRDSPSRWVMEYVNNISTDGEYTCNTFEHLSERIESGSVGFHEASLV